MDYVEMNARLERIEEQTQEVIDKMDKAQNSKFNRAYGYFVKLFSVIVLVAAVYTAVIGFAGSSAVLTILFLATWFIHSLAHFGVGLAKGFYDHQRVSARNDTHRLMKNI